MAFLRGLRSAAVRCVAAAALLGAFPAAAQAATWTVTTTGDGPALPTACSATTGRCPTIRDALAVAGPGDTISIPSASTHYNLNQGELTVSKPVTIAGGGQAATVIDAGGASRVMTLSAPPGTTTAISGLTLTGGSVTGAGPSAGGAGLLMQTGGLALTGVSINGNTAVISPAGGGDGGGGILDLSPDALSLSGSAVNGNTTRISGGGTGGGGILALAGPLQLSGTSVNGNVLVLSDPSGGTDGGGGIYAGPGSSLLLTGSTVADNLASISAAGGSNGGGGIYDAANSTRYLNDTLSANSLTVSQGASNGGGALYHEGASGTISDTTIAQNHGGGLFNNAGAYTLKNTIVAQNGTACAGPAPIFSAGYNLDGGTTCGMAMPTDLQNVNPRLAPLASNGGPTLTQALTPASPAIDAGSCTDATGATVSTDQRGVARPQPPSGRCDIGAFEYQPSSPAPLIVGGARPLVLGSGRATFTGLVNPSGLPTTARFEYGLDARYRPLKPYGHVTRVFQIAGGYGPATVSVTVNGLVPAALYHVRLIVANGAGSVVGPDQSFVTGTDRPPHPPVLGRYFNAAPAAGLVRVRIGGSFVPLTEPRRLRMGTEIDSRRGTLVVSAAGVGGTMMATFSGAVFRLGQPAFGPNRGIATAALVDGAFTGVPSYASCRARDAVVLQTLRAKVTGRFNVSGRYSAGLARNGTGQWTTSDRCDGTLTSVQRGVIQVVKHRRHATAIRVRAGGSYLARR